MTELIYLAAPYTSDKQTEDTRFKQVTRVAGHLMDKGYIVFSPITMCHPIRLACGLPGDWEYWKKYDAIFIEKADCLFILTLVGWRESKGIAKEIMLADLFYKPISYIVLESMDRIRILTRMEYEQESSGLAKDIH